MRVVSKVFYEMIRASTSLPCSYEPILPLTFRAYLDWGSLLFVPHLATRLKAECERGVRARREREWTTRGEAGSGAIGPGMEGSLAVRKGEEYEEIVDRTRDAVFGGPRRFEILARIRPMIGLLVRGGALSVSTSSRRAVPARFGRR